MALCRSKKNPIVVFLSIDGVFGHCAWRCVNDICRYACARISQRPDGADTFSNSAHCVFYESNAPIDANDVRRSIADISGVSKIDEQTQLDSIAVGEKNSAYAAITVSEFDGVRIGSELAKRIGLRAGENAEFSFEHNDLPKTFTVKIDEIKSFGMFDVDATRVEIPLTVFENTAKQRIRFGMLNISVLDPKNASVIADEIRKKLSPDLRVIDWTEANRPLFQALSAEEKGAKFVLGILALVSFLNISAAISMSIGANFADIGVLRAIGASSRLMRSVFVLKGAILSICAISCGAFLGILACLIANRFSLITLDEKIYSVGKISLTPDVSAILVICMLAFFAALGASFIPAFFTMKLNPSEILRSV